MQMKNGTPAIVALGVMAVTTTAAIASSPDKWAELMQRASAACSKASELKNVKTGTPIDFSDKVLVIVDGTWPQPHMKNAPARFACLYDKRTQKAEAAEAVR
jgi:hypothetical protein